VISLFSQRHEGTACAWRRGGSGGRRRGIAWSGLRARHAFGDAGRISHGAEFSSPWPWPPPWPMPDGLALHHRTGRWCGLGCCGRGVPLGPPFALGAHLGGAGL